MKNLWLKISIASVTVAVVATIIVVVFVNWDYNEATISGRFVGLNAKTVYLEQATADGSQIVDSTTLDQDGYYNFLIKNVSKSPSLYHVVYNRGRVPLLISSGENIELRAMGNVLMSYTVGGSYESELLRAFNKNFIDGQFQLQKIIREYKTADTTITAKLDSQYLKTYQDIKRKHISFIAENKSSMAAVYALYQRLPGDQHLVDAEKDLIYYRTVLDAVTDSYPESPFLLSLSTDIASMAARISLLKSIEVRNYPELEAPNMYGNNVKLSSLDGNVILVDFWSSEINLCNSNNADLKRVYEEYSSRGFEVYQVSADTSKVLWVTAVQEQKLPWVSVCDYGGNTSPLLRSYNVRRLPSNYLLDRNGNIVGKNLYGKALKDRLDKMFK